LPPGSGLGTAHPVDEESPAIPQFPLYLSLAARLNLALLRAGALDTQFPLLRGQKQSISICRLYRKRLCGYTAVIDEHDTKAAE